MSMLSSMNQDYVSQNDDFPSLPRSNAPQSKTDLANDHSIGNGSLLNSLSLPNSDLGSQVLSGFGGMIRSYLPPDSSAYLNMSILSGSSGVPVANPSPIPSVIGPSNAVASSSVIGPPVHSDSTSSQVSPNKQANAKYGLLGLLDVIRMADKDLNVLALGSDLAGFGLNLNSTECLYSSFTSPFSEQPSAPEPQFSVPLCYIMHPPALKQDNVSKFQMESLFYMFYMMPRDAMQVVAAQELYRRDWKYHSDLRLWLKLRTQQELLQSHSNVPFLYFDVNSWETRLFTTSYRGNIILGLLSEEDIKSGVNRPVNSNPMSNAIGPIGSNQGAIGSSISLGAIGSMQGIQSNNMSLGK